MATDQKARGSNPLWYTKKTHFSVSLFNLYKGFCVLSHALLCNRTPAGWRSVYTIFRVPKRYFCTFGEKEHTSKRVSIIAPDNAISKAQCATLLRYYACRLRIPYGTPRTCENTGPFLSFCFVRGFTGVRLLTFCIVK